MKYTLSDGVEIARRINEIVKPHGYYCGLTGSCLLGDGSNDDIYIIVYPSKTRIPHKTREEIVNVIELALCGSVYDASEYHDDDDKIVYKLEFDKYVVDLFLLK